MLFIALLVMVALSLAGIALIRSADTATIVAGNLAFKQAAVSAVDRSIEQAIKALFDPAADPAVPIPMIADKTADLLAQNYYACVQNAAGTGCLPANAPIPEIPTVLTTRDEIRRRRPQRRPGPPVDAASNKSYYVIERMCANAGAAGRHATAICRAPRWAPTRERSTTRASSARATPTTASPFASRAPATRWRMRRRFSSSPRAIARFPRSSTMTSSRPSAFRRLLRRRRGRRAGVAAAGRYAAPITTAASPRSRCRA